MNSSQEGIRDGYSISRSQVGVTSKDRVEITIRVSRR